MTSLPISSIVNEGKLLRTKGTVEEPLFLAKDVVESLGVKWNGKRSIEHVPEQWMVDLNLPPDRGVDLNSTPPESPFYLTELGLYFYLNRSDSPLALPWQIKVAEILKAIRQGQAGVPNDNFIQVENRTIPIPPGQVVYSLKKIFFRKSLDSCFTSVKLAHCLTGV